MHFPWKTLLALLVLLHHYEGAKILMMVPSLSQSNVHFDAKVARRLEAAGHEVLMYIPNYRFAKRFVNSF